MFGPHFGLSNLAGKRRGAAFSPASVSGLIAWYDPSDLSSLFQDSAMTVPVTSDGDPVGAVLDKSGNGYHAVQATTSARPIYQTDGTQHWLSFDGNNDVLSAGIVSADDSSIVMAAAATYIGAPSATSGGVFSNASWRNGGVQLGYNGGDIFLVSNTLTTETAYYSQVPTSTSGVAAAFTGNDAFAYHTAMGEIERVDNTHAQPSVGLQIGKGTQGGRTGHFPGKFWGGIYAQTNRTEARELIAWLETKLST